MQLLNTITALGLTLLPTILAADAPVVENNPQGAQYIAALPKGNAVSGAVIAISNTTGTGVNFDVSISGLPAQGGPFLYHIHEYQVSADGNCSSTGSHLDPYMAGDTVTCDATKPETCQVGDLSGKHGKMPGPNYSAHYNDPYVSTKPGSEAFMGNRSLVVHYANKTIITCANFTTNGKGGPIQPPPPMDNSTTTAPNSAPTAVPQMALFAGALGLAAGLL